MVTNFNIFIDFSHHNCDGTRFNTFVVSKKKRLN